MIHVPSSSGAYRPLRRQSLSAGSLIRPRSISPLIIRQIGPLRSASSMIAWRTTSGFKSSRSCAAIATIREQISWNLLCRFSNQSSRIVKASLLKGGSGVLPLIAAADATAMLRLFLESGAAFAFEVALAKPTKDGLLGSMFFQSSPHHTERMMSPQGSFAHKEKKRLARF